MVSTKSGRHRRVFTSALAFSMVGTSLLGHQVRPFVEQARVSVRSLGLSSIVDAAAFPGDRVLVLDDQSHVVLLDRRLRVIARLWRRSDGGAAFREPAAVAAGPDGRPMVLDRARQQVVFLELARAGVDLIPMDSLGIGTAYEWMCPLARGSFLVYGLHDGRRLHVVDRRGRKLRSFAPADTAYSETAQDQFAMGRLACDVERGEVLVTSALLPVVEAYAIASGSATWVDTLRPFRGVAVIQRDHGLGLRSGPAGHSVVSAAFRLGECRVFQSSFVSRRDGATADTTVSYIYSVPDRTWLPPRLDIPAVFYLGGGLGLAAVPGEGALSIVRLAIPGCLEQDAGRRGVRVN